MTNPSSGLAALADFTLTAMKEAPPEKPLKRKRVSACVSCYQAKTKCTGEIPCGTTLTLAEPDW